MLDLQDKFSEELKYIMEENVLELMKKSVKEKVEGKDKVNFILKRIEQQLSKD